MVQPGNRLTCLCQLVSRLCARLTLWSYLSLELLCPFVIPLLRQTEALELLPQVVVRGMNLVELRRSQSLNSQNRV